VEISDDAIEAALRAELEHVYEDSRLFERYLHSRNITRDDVWEGKRRELQELRLLEQRGAVEPSEAELREYYENNRERWTEGERARIRGITIRVRRNSTEAVVEESRLRAEAARARIEAGESFADVAREVSETHDRLRGGDMGWLVRGRRRELVDSGIERAIFTTRPGSLTPVLRTDAGFQFFELMEVRPAGPRLLDEVEEIIRQPIRRRIRERLRLEIVSELEQRHAIEYFESNWGLEAESE
jgi:parvulin-like peptidyl-prolyl isomerase